MPHPKKDDLRAAIMSSAHPDKEALLAGDPGFDSLMAIANLIGIDTSSLGEHASDSETPTPPPAPPARPSAPTRPSFLASSGSGAAKSTGGSSVADAETIKKIIEGAVAPINAKLGDLDTKVTAVEKTAKEAKESAEKAAKPAEPAKKPEKKPEHKEEGKVMKTLKFLFVPSSGDDSDHGKSGH